MTENEIKILQFLYEHDYYNQNISDIILIHTFKLSDTDYEITINGLLEKNYIFLTVRPIDIRCWETTDDGKQKANEINKIRSQLVLDKNLKTSTNLVKFGKENKWATAIIAGLTLVAISFQAYYAKIQTQLLDEQTRILQEDKLLKKVKSSDTCQLNLIPSKIRINTENKDSTKHK